VRMGAEANYGEVTTEGNDDTTVENARAYANVKRTLSEMTFCSLDGSVFYDDIALIDYRFTLGPALGMYLVKTETTKLSAEVGVVYIWEKEEDIKEDFVAYRVAQRLDHEFSETARIWQQVQYLPEAEEFDNYLLDSELGVEATLNGNLNLRVVLQDKYDSKPAQGLNKNDVTLIAGISVKL